jgi:hypothetical protein
MQTTSFAFTVALIALIGTPLSSPIGAWVLRRSSPSIQRRIFGSMAVFLACLAVALMAGISTTKYEANVLLLGLGLICVGMLGVSAFRIKRPWNFVLGSLATLLLCASLLIGTFGVIAVMFIVGDSVPIYELRTNDHRGCYVTSFGNALTSDAGYDVATTRQWTFAPFLEHRTAYRRFDNPPLTPAEACTAALEVAS